MALGTFVMAAAGEALVGKTLEGAGAAVLSKEADFRAALVAAQVLSEEMRANVRYLRNTRYTTMDEKADGRALVAVAQGLRTNAIQPFMGRNGEPTPLHLFLDSIPVPSTSITLLRLVRRVAHRLADLQEGAEALARAPQHAQPMRISLRLRHLEEDLQELILYFSEFPGIKRGTSIGPRGNIMQRMLERLRGRHHAPVELPMVERRKKWEAMRTRQQWMREHRMTVATERRGVTPGADTTGESPLGPAGVVPVR